MVMNITLNMNEYMCVDAYVCVGVNVYVHAGVTVYIHVRDCDNGVVCLYMIVYICVYDDVNTSVNTIMKVCVGDVCVCG